MVSLEVVSGARTMFPDLFSKTIDKSFVRSMPMSKLLLVELLMGLGNRVVERRKALSSLTITYNFKLDGFVMRVLDSSVKETKAPFVAA